MPDDLLQRLAARTPEAGSAATKPEPPLRWVPIRSLSERHRPRLRTHLLALDGADRYLRFGYAASDTQIGSYVDRIDFARDEVFGIFNRRLTLIAWAHLAYQEDQAAEFGVSVLSRWRGRGYGARLFDHAVLHARNRGVERLLIHALSENAAMLKIARAAGAKVVRMGPESEAQLVLPPEDLVSRVGEMVESRAAEIDYHLKVQAKRAGELLDAIAEVRSRLGGRSIASE